MRRVALSLLLCVLSGCAVLGEPTLDRELSARAREADEQSRIASQLKQHYAAGEQLYQAAQYEAASKEFQSMLALKPDDEYALYRLGAIEFRKGAFDKSAAYFERTVQANPRHEKAHYNLATIRLMQAEQHFKYYAALAGRGTDLRKVTVLLGSIDTFATGEDSAGSSSSSLDKIAGALKK
jgi:tetratricopeptide (TPR) repeat protein